MGVRKLTESGRRKTSKRRDLGSHLWVVFDREAGRSIRQPVRINEATAFLSSCIREAFLRGDLAQAKTRFLGATGSVWFPGIKFPEEELDAVRADVDQLLRQLVAGPIDREVEVRRERYLIRLRLAADHGTSEKWIESYLASVEGPQRRPVSKDRGVDLESLRQAMDRIVHRLPAEYDARRRALAEVADGFRQQVAQALEGEFNRRIGELPQATYEDKKTVAKFVNAELRRFGLAIRSPRTGDPTLLQAYPGNHPDVGRYRLDYTDAEGHRHHAVSWTTLPRLELMLDNLTRAPYGQRSPRSR